LLKERRSAHLGIVMLGYCLFCGQAFSPDDGADSLRAGVRIAFDPERGRIWAVCDRCHGWNLWPLEDRLPALYHLERSASRARLLYRTENIALLEAPGLELIRVGKTELPEEAWWRYGRELRRRRDRYQSRLSKVGAATYAAVSYVGVNLGFEGITGEFSLEDDVYADVMRWRTFGRTVWSGRAPCPQCQSVLIKLFFFRARFLRVIPGDDEQLTIGFPCARCDPWTVDKVHRLEGRAAEYVLRRVLAYQNIGGASKGELANAVEAVEEAGSAQQLVQSLAAGQVPLYGLDRTQSLALEISVNENVERRQLALEGAAIDAAWHGAERLAAIIDQELSSSSPRGTIEQKARS
jgi:hypothetical protein